ncbi:hypothetical protein D9615_010652 [Tricholomella constricta]|uniref:Uncharacterized protein n=1 Tax=Tricholomella constricta TaxID=117010 RepID=A0A8H5GIV6_9AGAR|nr:hypothetical protein D9615_010652 [Tricholomella constricta]
MRSTKSRKPQRPPGLLSKPPMPMSKHPSPLAPSAANVIRFPLPIPVPTTHCSCKLDRSFSLPISRSCFHSHSTLMLSPLRLPPLSRQHLQLASTSPTRARCHSLHAPSKDDLSAPSTATASP